MTTPITAYVPPLPVAASRPKENKGKKHFSLMGELKQMAAEALGGSSSSNNSKERARPASAMNISVLREGEEGGIPSGVKMDLVPLAPASSPPFALEKKKKPRRATTSFSCNIFTDTSEDFNSAMEECKQMVMEAGGTILEVTYPGGFLYDLSFATIPNPLDNLDETAGGGYITINSYEADMTPHPHPLRSHPVMSGSGVARSILEHMNRFGLAPNSHSCNGRDKPCLPSCEYRRTTRKRPASMNARTWEDLVTTRVSNSPPQLAPSRPLSTIRVEDILELGDGIQTSTALSPMRLKRNSRNLSLLLEQDDTLKWLEDQETVKQFREENICNDGKKFDDGRRPRPTPIFGMVQDNHYVANCRPPIPRRSSSLKSSSKSSSETNNPKARRDSIVTVVQQETDPIFRPRTLLESVEPCSPISVEPPNQPPNSPHSNEPCSPMYSELSTENIEKLQQKLTGIRGDLGRI